MADVPPGSNLYTMRHSAHMSPALTSGEEQPYSRWQRMRSVVRLSKYASSEWIQWIFGELEFEKPYFLTYFNTTGFMLWNLGYLFVPSWRKIPFWRVPSDKYEGEELAEFLVRGELPPEEASNDEVEVSGEPVSDSAGQFPLASSPMKKSKSLLRYGDGPDAVEVDGVIQKPPYSFMKIWTCAVLFCPAWFVANFLFNLSLSYTSVATNTILSATSTIWTLLLSYVLLRMAVGPLRWVGVVVCMTGSLMVGLTGASREGDTVFGDVIALVSAMFYGIYTTVLRWCLPDDDRYGMGQVFGAVGVLNFLVLWFPLPILNASGFEVFEWPTAKQAWPLVVNALIGTNLSDVLWARSVILTSPVVATLGLSLTTPLSMVVDAILHHATYQPQYIAGAILVVVGFVTANLPLTITWTMLWNWLRGRRFQGSSPHVLTTHDVQSNQVAYQCKIVNRSMAHFFLAPITLVCIASYSYLQHKGITSQLCLIYIYIYLLIVASRSVIPLLLRLPAQKIEDSVSGIDKPLGKALGRPLGRPLGKALGRPLGKALGRPLVETLGRRLGKTLGRPLGKALGRPLCKALGRPLGKALGRPLGKTLGRPLGKALGRPLCKALGRPLGKALGRPLGETLGRRLGKTLGRPLGRPLCKALGRPLVEILVRRLGKTLGRPLGRPLGKTQGKPLDEK
eukprot:gene4551-3313_t